MVTISQLKEKIKSEIIDEENSAEELIQELDNEEEADRRFAMIQAYKNILEWIIENE